MVNRSWYLLKCYLIAQWEGELKDLSSSTDDILSMYNMVKGNLFFFLHGCVSVWRWYLITGGHHMISKCILTCSACQHSPLCQTQRIKVCLLHRGTLVQHLWRLIYFLLNISIIRLSFYSSSTVSPDSCYGCKETFTATSNGGHHGYTHQKL